MDLVTDEKCNRQPYASESSYLLAQHGHRRRPKVSQRCGMSCGWSNLPRGFWKAGDSLGPSSGLQSTVGGSGHSRCAGLAQHVGQQMRQYRGQAVSRYQNARGMTPSVGGRSTGESRRVLSRPQTHHMGLSTARKTQNGGRHHHAPCGSASWSASALACDQSCRLRRPRSKGPQSAQVGCCAGSSEP